MNTLFTSFPSFSYTVICGVKLMFFIWRHCTFGFLYCIWARCQNTKRLRPSLAGLSSWKLMENIFTLSLNIKLPFCKYCSVRRHGAGPFINGIFSRFLLSTAGFPMITSNLLFFFRFLDKYLTDARTCSKKLFFSTSNFQKVMVILAYVIWYCKHKIGNITYWITSWNWKGFHFDAKISLKI